MKPIFSRKQLSSLLRKQYIHYINHHPENNWIKKKNFLFILANNLYDRKCPDRYRILRNWLEPETTVNNVETEKPRSHNIYDDIRLEGNDINNYLSGDYLFESEYNQLPIQDRTGKTLIKKPGLLFYLLARITEMEESDIINAFYAGEGLDLSEYETYCVYDIFEYYFNKTGLSVKDFCELLNIEGFKPSTFSKLLLRNNGIGKTDDEFIPVGDDITLEQFLKLAEPLQIPDKWKNFCLCRLAHKKDSFSFMNGYNDAFEDSLEDILDFMLFLKQKGQEEKEQILETVSQLYDYLNFTVLNLPPAWINQEKSNDMAVLKIIKPRKKNDNQYTTDQGEEKKQSRTVYEMKLSDYRAILEEVVAYAKFVMEDMLNQTEN